MKLLAIAPRIPTPGGSGDQALSFHRLSFLSKRHSIHLICFASRGGARERKVLEDLGITVDLVKWRFLDAFWFWMLALFDTSTPLQCAFFTSFLFRKRFREIFKKFKPDALYSVTFRSINNISLCGVPIYIDLIDSIGLNYSREMKVANRFKRIFISVECARVIDFERRLAQSAAKCFVVSDIDRDFIGDSRIEVLALGVEFKNLDSNRKSSDNLVIVFSGNMFYQPNVEAVLWFVEHCWSHIKENIRNVKLVIAGRSPKSSIKKLEVDPDIIVTGRVKSMFEVLCSSHIAIAPMQSGSGMQFKVLESMACSIPVITTTVGLGDIKAKAGDGLLVADTPELFSKYVINLLLDSRTRIHLGELAHAYVSINHNWDSINERFVNVCGL